MAVLERVVVLAAFFAVVVGASALLAATASTAADDARLRAYGRHLSAECSACHRVDGVDNGIPSITGWPIDDFVTTLRFYKEGARQNSAMVSVAQSLDDAQMEALAAYYGSLPKAPTKGNQQPRR